MAYTAYETGSGKAMDQVEAFCLHLTTSGVFTTTTSPTLAQVEAWLTISHHLIAGWLAEAGYDTTQTDTEVLGILEELNSVDSVIKVELNNPTTINGEPNDRFKWFQERRDELRDLIMGRALAELGATRSEDVSSSLLAASGISKSDKQGIRDDTDVVQHRFRRDFGHNPRAGSSVDNDLDNGIIES